MRGVVGITLTASTTAAASSALLSSGTMTPVAPSRRRETVILLHPPLPSVGVSIVMERERQQNDSLVSWG